MELPIDLYDASTILQKLLRNVWVIYNIIKDKTQQAVQAWISSAVNLHTDALQP